MKQTAIPAAAARSFSDYMMGIECNRRSAELDRLAAIVKQQPATLRRYCLSTANRRSVPIRVALDIHRATKGQADAVATVTEGNPEHGDSLRKFIDSLAVEAA